MNSFKRSLISSFLPSLGQGDTTPSIPRTGNTTMVLLLGDSNTGFSDQTAPATDATVEAWKDSTASLVLAQDPLEYISWAGLTTYGTKLGQLISAKTGNDVTLVPAGQGGSGFQTGDWLAGGTLYLEAVQRFNDAYAASTNPTDIVICISLGANNIGTRDYITKLDDIIARLRADLTGASSTTPAVMINLNEDYITSNGRRGINDIAADLPRRVAYSHTIDMGGIRSNGDLDLVDFTHHYDADALAGRIYNGIALAKANTSAVGSTLLSTFFLTPTVTDNGDGTITVSVAFMGYYDPQPNIEKINIYRANDLSGNGEELVEDNIVTAGVSTINYTLPAEDNKYYYGKFEGVNSIGTADWSTDDAYFNGPFVGGLPLLLG